MNLNAMVLCEACSAKVDRGVLDRAESISFCRNCVSRGLISPVQLEDTVAKAQDWQNVVKGKLAAEKLVKGAVTGLFFPHQDPSLDGIACGVQWPTGGKKEMVRDLVVVERQPPHTVVIEGDGWLKVETFDSLSAAMQAVENDDVSANRSVKTEAVTKRIINDENMIVFEKSDDAAEVKVDSAKA